MIYAGIGARKTPENILNEMTLIAALLAVQGHTLRSGGAIGADKAFQKGCESVNGSKVIRVATMWKPALDHAATFHPNWGACDEHARALHARNSLVMLGDHFDTPVNLVICWTLGGATIGGTGQALRIADAYRIPVYNFGMPGRPDFWSWFNAL